jgi:hypothetical protein
MIYSIQNLKVLIVAALAVGDSAGQAESAISTIGQYLETFARWRRPVIESSSHWKIARQCGAGDNMRWLIRRPV